MYYIYCILYLRFRHQLHLSLRFIASLLIHGSLTLLLLLVVETLDLGQNGSHVFGLLHKYIYIFVYIVHSRISVQLLIEMYR